MRVEAWNKAYDSIRSNEEKDRLLKFSAQINKEIIETEQQIQQYEAEIYFTPPPEHYEWDDEYEDIGEDGWL